MHLAVSIKPIQVPSGWQTASREGEGPGGGGGTDSFGLGSDCGIYRPPQKILGF